MASPRVTGIRPEGDSSSRGLWRHYRHAKKRTGTWDSRVYRRVQFGDSGSIKGTAKEQVKVVSEGGLSGKRKPAFAGRVFGSLRSKRIFALSVSECNPLNRRDADSKLRFKSLKESKGLISATCGREYTTLVEYAVREGEVTARIDKIAVPKRAVLKLAVINQNPVPLEGTNSSPSRSRIDVVSHRDLSVYPVDSGVVESTSGTSIVGFRIVDGAPQIIWGIVQRNELRVNT